MSQAYRAYMRRQEVEVELALRKIAGRVNDLVLFDGSAFRVKDDAELRAEIEAEFEARDRLQAARLRGAARAAASTAQPTAEPPPTRAARRLARFRALGGVLRAAGHSWHCGGKRSALAALSREEKAAGRPRHDPKDVKRDLMLAMRAQCGS